MCPIFFCKRTNLLAFIHKLIYIVFLCCLGFLTGNVFDWGAKEVFYIVLLYCLGFLAGNVFDWGAKEVYLFCVSLLSRISSW